MPLNISRVNSHGLIIKIDLWKIGRAEWRMGGEIRFGEAEGAGN